MTTTLPGTDRRTAGILKRLELDVNRRLDGILHGDYRGLVPGHGSEPGESREYVPGDDVRHIDWNVTARMSHLYVRETIADRELETWLVIDQSPSLDFGTSDWEKRELALASAAAMGFLTNRGGNRIGAVLGNSGHFTTLPPRQGRANLLGILHRVARAERTPSGQATLGPLLARTNAVTKRRGAIVAISDWLDPIATWDQALGLLATRHHVIAVELVDPRELELPAVGVLNLVDVETGTAREVNTNSAKVRERFAAESLRQRKQITETLSSHGVGHVVLRTDHDWLGELAGFVTQGKRRRAQVGRNA